MTRRWRPWTDIERDVLRLEYAASNTEILATLLGRSYSAVAAEAARLGLRKSAAFLASAPSGRFDGHRSAGQRFVPGHVPWNKGRRFDAGGRSVQTQFQRGNRPRNELPLGSYRITKDGYLEQKISDRPGRSRLRWAPVHRLVWEAANGPLAPGSVVVFRPGRRTTTSADITLDALEVVSRAELMARNSVHNLPPELVDVIRLRGVLNRHINHRSDQ